MSDERKTIAWPDRKPKPGYRLVIERATTLLDLWNAYPKDKAPSFTCDNCAHAPHCALAYDLYNTNGDCLAGK